MQALNLMGKAEANAGSLLFGCEKKYEDFFQRLFDNSDSIIAATSHALRRSSRRNSAPSAAI